MKKYITKDIDEVFSGLLLNYVSRQGLSKSNMDLIMNRVEEFKKENNMRFVQFFGPIDDPILIFENL